MGVSSQPLRWDEQAVLLLHGVLAFVPKHWLGDFRVTTLVGNCHNLSFDHVGPILQPPNVSFICGRKDQWSTPLNGRWPFSNSASDWTVFWIEWCYGASPNLGPEESFRYVDYNIFLCIVSCTACIFLAGFSHPIGMWRCYGNCCPRHGTHCQENNLHESWLPTIITGVTQGKTTAFSVVEYCMLKRVGVCICCGKDKDNCR